MSRLIPLFKESALTRAIRYTSPFLLVGTVSFNAMADCGASGGTISQPTTDIRCQVTDENAKVTIDSTASGNIFFGGNNQQLVVNAGAELNADKDPVNFIGMPESGVWTLTNNGKMSASGTDSYADVIEVWSKDKTHNKLQINVNNNGEMTTPGGSVINVVDNAGGKLTINNSNKGKMVSNGAATISVKDTTVTTEITNKGEISNTGTAAAIETTGKTKVYNAGTIKAAGPDAIKFSGVETNDELILDTSSIINGTVDAGTGSDTLTLKGTSGSATLDNSSKQYKNFEKLVKDENSIWTLKGANKFDQGTTVNAGSLLLGDPDSTLTTSSVTVNSGATFGGYGSVKGNVTNSGTLAIANAAPGMESGEMSNFTIDGNYTGNNGNLVMNMALDDDTNTTGSKLVITGDTAGTTNVTINNMGGKGGQTIEGIEVIEVDGKSDGEFVQNGRIVAGAYDYSLVKGKTSNAADGNWYLTSALTDDNSGSDTDDTGSDSNNNSGSDSSNGSGSSYVEPPVRPEAGAYLGNQSAAKSMFMSTMHDRMGEQNFTQALASDDYMPSTWLRTSGSRTESKAGNNVENSTDSYMFQMGNDITAWSANATDRGHFGFMFGYGYADTDSYSAASKAGARHANGKTKGYNTGLYGTWYADAKNMTGLYVDSSLQYSWFDNETKGEGLASQKYDSDLWQASLETGYTMLAIQNAEKSLYVEPQAQVIYSSMNTDDFSEANGTRIHNADSDGYTTRLGMRIFGRVMKNTTAVEPFVEANWWHDTAANSLMMDADKVYDNMPSNRYEVKGGVEGKITNSFHSWANVGYQAGENDYSQITGMAGVKYLW